MTEEAWQAGLLPALLELPACHSLGSLSGQGPGPLGLGGGDRKSGVVLGPGVQQGILVGCVCMCVCVGANQLLLSVERVQIA